MIEIRNFHFYSNGNNFYGSYKGMRFAIEQKKNDDGQYFEISIWCEPWTIESTPDEKMKKESFDFSPEGLEKIKEYLGRIYAENEAAYLSCAKAGFAQMKTMKK